MIQKETARNGQAIFKVDGLSLVSSFDPSKEANAWAEKALQELGDQNAVIVIGAACGYHLIALQRLRPALAILVVEASAEIKTSVLEIHPSLQQAQIIVAETAMHLTESLELRDFLSRRFAVLTHSGQASTRPEWSISIGDFLTGRDALSFLLQLRMRPELHSLFDEKKITTLGQTDGLISILTIRSLFKADASASRERRIWRVLEELVV